jgi:hypothetical protein
MVLVLAGAVVLITYFIWNAVQHAHKAAAYEDALKG